MRRGRLAGDPPLPPPPVPPSISLRTNGRATPCFITDGLRPANLDGVRTNGRAPCPQPSPVKGEGECQSLLPWREKARMRGNAPHPHCHSEKPATRNLKLPAPNQADRSS